MTECSLDHNDDEGRNTRYFKVAVRNVALFPIDEAALVLYRSIPSDN